MKETQKSDQSLESIEFLLKSIDFQLTKLLKFMSELQEQRQQDIHVEVKQPEVQERPRLLTTKEASEKFGLSQFELRRGFKEGKYPAIKLGNGGWGKIKWRADLLEETLKNKH